MLMTKEAKRKSKAECLDLPMKQGNSDLLFSNSLQIGEEDQ